MTMLSRLSGTSFLGKVMFVYFYIDLMFEHNPYGTPPQDPSKLVI